MLKDKLHLRDGFLARNPAELWGEIYCYVSWEEGEGERRCMGGSDWLIGLHWVRFPRTLVCCARANVSKETWDKDVGMRWGVGVMGITSTGARDPGWLMSVTCGWVGFQLQRMNVFLILSRAVLVLVGQREEWVAQTDNLNITWKCYELLWWEQNIPLSCTSVQGYELCIKADGEL